MIRFKSKEVYAVIIWGAGAVAFILVAVVFFQTRSIVGAIRDSQKDRVPVLTATKDSAHDAAQAAKSAAQGTRMIRSCVQPTGKCFKDGQHRQGTILAQFNQWTVATAVCAATLVPQDPSAGQKVLVDRVTACAVARLARQGGNDGSTKR